MPEHKDSPHSQEALVEFQGRGFADVVQLNCCRPFLLEALLLQWPSIRRCASRTMVEHKTPESNKSTVRNPGISRYVRSITSISSRRWSHQARPLRTA